MGLKLWNLLTDLYDHAQLADNWAKVDYHDHSSGKGVQIPTDGLADGAVTPAKMNNLVDPTGAYLSLKPLVRLSASFGAAAATGTYPLWLNFASATGLPTLALTTPFYLDPADWASTGRTVKYVIRGSVITNAVAPASTFAFCLNPVATWGGTSGNPPTVATLSAAVASSTTTTIVAPGAGAPSAQVTSTFDAPVAGWYTLSLLISNVNTAANSAIAAHAALFVKQV
jgi:hypothetical protein